MKNLKEYYVTWVLVVAMFVVGVFVGKATTPIVAQAVEEEAVMRTVEEKPAVFDTSIIEALWCNGDEDEGTIRMVGAWWYADGLVEDELGDVWSIEQEIDVCDFLLLWIADNGTVDDPTDDIIIKVWREAY
jgi:hypothetical protein